MSESFIQADIGYFKSVPWCTELISAPGVVLFTPTSRQPDSDAVGATKDQLFRKTLRHGEAVPNCIGFYDDPAVASSVNDANGTGDGNGSTARPGPITPTLYIKKASLLFDLGPGVAGYNGSAHGGLISSLIDEAMGSLIFVNHVAQAALVRQGGRLPPGTLDLNNTRVFTASMAVRFLKPVPAPGIVVVEARLGSVEGRKISFDVRVRSERGQEFAQCDGLWLSLPLEKV